MIEIKGDFDGVPTAQGWAVGSYHITWAEPEAFPIVDYTILRLEDADGNVLDCLPGTLENPDSLLEWIWDEAEAVMFTLDAEGSEGEPS